MLTAAAAQATVELAPAPANVTEKQIKLGIPALSSEIQLRNSGKEVRYYRETNLLTRAGDGATRPAVWKRVPATAGDNSIPAGAQITLELSAELPQVGVYETFVDTYGKDDKGVEVPDRRIRVLVTREADALPAELMVEPKPAAETWPWNQEKRHYILALRNTSTKRLSFTPPEIVSFSNKSGDDLLSVGSSLKASLDSTSCGSPLDPGKGCPIDLNLKNGLEPGEYQIGIGVGGDGGGWSQRTQTIRVRASAWLAFIVIMVGAYAGSYVQAWRTRGRKAVAAVIEITRLREAAARLATDDGLKPLLRQVLADIDNVETQARKDVDVTAEIERLRLWIRNLAPAMEGCQRLDKLSEASQTVLRAQSTAVMRAVAKSNPTEAERTALEAMIQAFAENLNNWPALERSLEKAASLLAAMDALLGAAGAPPADLAALQTLRDGLSSAVETAKAPLPAQSATDSISDRRTALDREIDKTEKQAPVAAHELVEQLFASKRQQFDQLPAGDAKSRLQILLNGLAAWEAGASGKPADQRLGDLANVLRSGGQLRTMAPVGANTTPNIPPVEFPTQLLVPPRGASLVDLQANQSFNETLTNALILIATGLAGVITLWVPNATWGSAGDLIGAVLAGLVARVVIGEAGSAVR